jgi:hypothetical protein
MNKAGWGLADGSRFVSDGEKDLTEIEARLRRMPHVGSDDAPKRRQEAFEAICQVRSDLCQIACRHPDAPSLTRIGQAVSERFEAVRWALYPPGYASACERARQGNVAAAEPLIQLLEENLLDTGPDLSCRLLKRLPLSESQQNRLRKVILGIVDTRHNKHFREYRRLARKLDSPAFYQALAVRSHASDPDVRRRAEWILATIDQERRMRRHDGHTL